MLSPKRAPPVAPVPLTAAMTFWLVTGQDSPVRLPGWAAFVWGAPTPEQAWAQHGEALTREAGAAGFEPFGVHHRVPRGPAVEAWAQTFIAAHRY